MRRLFYGFCLTGVLMLAGPLGVINAYNSFEEFKVSGPVQTIDIDLGQKSIDLFSLKLQATSYPAGGKARISFLDASGVVIAGQEQTAVLFDEYDKTLSPKSENFESVVNEHAKSGLISSEFKLPEAAKRVRLELTDLQNIDKLTLQALDKLPENAGDDFTTSATSLYIDGIRIITREEWGCGENSSTGGNPSSPYYCNGPEWKPSYRPITHIVVHHTATDPGTGNYGAHVRAIWRGHAISNGWFDVGYNYMIAPDGTIFEGRYGGEGVTAGHATEHNRGTVGIGLLGNYSTNSPSAAMLSSLETLVATLAGRYNLDPLERANDYAGMNNYRLSGHRNWGSTSCPGNNTYQRLDGIIARTRVRAKNIMTKRQNHTGCPDGYTSLPGVQCGKITYNASWKSTSGNVLKIAELGGNILSINSGSNDIQSTDPAANSTTFATLSGQPVDLDTRNSKLYALEAGRLTIFDDTGVVIRQEPLSFAARKLSVGTDRVYILDTSNNAYVYNETDFSLSGATALPINFIGVPFFLAEEKLAAGPDVLGRSVTMTNTGVVTIVSSSRVAHLSAAKQNGEIFALSNSGAIQQLNLADNSTSHYSYTNHQAAARVYPAGDRLLLVNAYTDIISLILGGVHEKLNLPGSGSISGSVRIANVLYFSRDGSSDIGKLDLASSTIPRTQKLFRFWSEQKKGHFYTSSIDEKNNVINTSPSAVWSYENESYSVYNMPQPGSLAVYRFWSSTKQKHFYTIDPAEKAAVEANYPDNVWKYERVAFYAFPGNTTGTKPVYRFWSNRYQGHFYTISESEKNQIIAGDSANWKFEGIAFYAYE